MKQNAFKKKNNNNNAKDRQANEWISVFMAFFFLGRST